MHEEEEDGGRRPIRPFSSPSSFFFRKKSEKGRACKKELLPALEGEKEGKVKWMVVHGALKKFSFTFLIAASLVPSFFLPSCADGNGVERDGEGGISKREET